VIEIGLGLLQALEALSFERSFLRVADAGFDFTFSVRVSDSARHSHHAVVGKHIAVERIKRGFVDVGSQHALAQIIEHHHARAAAETAKGFLVQLGPRLRTGTKDQQADRLAAVAQRHHEQPGAPVLAALLITHHRTGAIVDLGLFSRCGQNDSYGLRRGSAAQFTDEALDRLIAAAIAVLTNQVLPDGHGIAPAAQSNFDALSIRFTGAGGGDRGGGLRLRILWGFSSRVGGHLIGRFCRSPIAGWLFGWG
jgi:hypothetical protein